MKMLMEILIYILGYNWLLQLLKLGFLKLIFFYFTRPFLIKIKWF